MIALVVLRIDSKVQSSAGREVRVAIDILPWLFLLIYSVFSIIFKKYHFYNNYRMAEIIIGVAWYILGIINLFCFNYIRLYHNIEASLWAAAGFIVILYSLIKNWEDKQE